MANWVSALKELSSKRPTEEEIDAIAHEVLHEKSDRGAALIDASQVEAVLRMLVQAHLVTLTVAEDEALFERDGPLSSFSKLIRVAFAFGLIDADMQRNLNIMREIRNAFAHAQTAIKFESPAVSDACNLFTPWFEKFEDTSYPANHPRTKFVATSTRLMMVFGEARKANYKVGYPLRFK